MYRSAHSRVLLAGDRGERFSISRSVRQGCPLAPTLFLFLAEAMSNFLSDQDTGLRGLRLPIRDEDLLDAEFADDTAMYLAGDEDNLARFQTALETFCDALGAKINWNKSCGFWVGGDTPPGWLPDPLFWWVLPGTSICYLGCHVGLSLGVVGRAVDCASPLEYQEEACVLEYGPPLSSWADCGGQSSSFFFPKKKIIFINKDHPKSTISGYTTERGYKRGFQYDIIKQKQVTSGSKLLRDYLITRLGFSFLSS